MPSQAYGMRLPIHPSRPPICARAELMQQIAAIVTDKEWTQAKAAKRCDVTQPRINDLLGGRVSRFSLDALVNLATAIGRRVHMELEAA